MTRAARTFYSRGMKIIGILLLFSITIYPAQTSLQSYQQGLVREQAYGDLSGAIHLYERAAKEAASDRDLAAKALLRAANCYKQLGDPKASEIFGEIVRTYPEQRESVAGAQS